VRQQFGKPIAHKQSIQFMIADMATEIEALRSLIYRTAWLADTGRPFSREAAMCKLYGSEVLHRCVDWAVQIHGGMGYMRDYFIELMYRDARITESLKVPVRSSASSSLPTSSVRSEYAFRPKGGQSKWQRIQE
jgi:alkylation response protein AidB-like acyl-CoA dehydrogenase